MQKPYVICHMTTSLNGKVTGAFLSAPQAATAIDLYYQINRDYHADAYACGRVTMQGSFCGDAAPDLADCRPVDSTADYLPPDSTALFAVAFDPHGRLAWEGNRIADPDGDPGYDKARILEVLTEQVDPRYRGYLQARNIPYITAGTTAIDIPLALHKLRTLLNIQTLLLEGGSVLDGAFAMADAIDEISLVVCPLVADTADKPLFMQSNLTAYTLAAVKTYPDGAVWLNYKTSRE